MKQIAAQKDAEWHSNRPEKKSARLRRRRPPSQKALRGGHAAPVHRADEGEAGGEAAARGLAFRGEVGWLPGHRHQGRRGGVLISRNGNDLTAKFPEAAAALRQLPCERAVVDGEIVALDAQGRSSFQLLQDYQLNAKRPPLRYYVFDLLSLEGEETMRLPLGEAQGAAGRAAGKGASSRWPPRLPWTRGTRSCWPRCGSWGWRASSGKSGTPATSPAAGAGRGSRSRS